MSKKPSEKKWINLADLRNGQEARPESEINNTIPVENTPQPEATPTVAATLSPLITEPEIPAPVINNPATEWLVSQRQAKFPLPVDWHNIDDLPFPGVEDALIPAEYWKYTNPANEFITDWFFSGLTDDARARLVASAVSDGDLALEIISRWLTVAINHQHKLALCAMLLDDWFDIKPRRHSEFVTAGHGDTRHWHAAD